MGLFSKAQVRSLWAYLNVSAKVLVSLVAILFNVPGLPWRPIDHFETFSGQQSVTMAEVEAGRRAIPYDIVNDADSQNILSARGMANALYHTACLIPGSGATTAPVCSTFVFMQLICTARVRCCLELDLERGMLILRF